MNTDNTFYQKYVGCYAKRFYTPFLKNNIFKIEDFQLIQKEKFVLKGKQNFVRKFVKEAYFKMKDDEGNEWEWDVEDCVIITNEMPVKKVERVANVNDPQYKGYNPYIQNNMKEHLSKLLYSKEFDLNKLKEETFKILDECEKIPISRVDEYKNIINGIPTTVLMKAMLQNIYVDYFSNES